MFLPLFEIVSLLLSPIGYYYVYVIITLNSK